MSRAPCAVLRTKPLRLGEILGDVAAAASDCSLLARVMRVNLRRDVRGGGGDVCGRARLLGHALARLFGLTPNRFRRRARSAPSPWPAPSSPLPTDRDHLAQTLRLGADLPAGRRLLAERARGCRRSAANGIDRAA